MHTIRRIVGRGPSPALVVASLALAVALSGTGYAAFVLPANSVGAKQLKANAVVPKKIAGGAVTGAKVKNGSLMAADFKAGQLPAGPRGTKGDPGPQGPKGDPGPSTGPAGGDLRGAYPNPTIAPGAVTASKLAPEEAWRDVGASGQPAFESGWANYGFTYEAVGFRKDRDGVVHLRGGGALPGNSPLPTTMFTLPSGYRPAHVELFNVASTDGNSGLRLGAIEITPTGVVSVYADTNDNFVSLSGIDFTATQ